MTDTTHTRPPGSGSRQGELGDEGSAELPSLAPWEPPASPAVPEADPDRVRALVREARMAASEADRAGVAGTLNQQLDALAAGGGSREVADLLEQLLESGQLAGLEDPGGRACRAAATEALTRLGFPYALEVRPEDLAFLRGQDGASQDFPWRPTAAGALLVAGIAAQWGVPLLQGESLEGPVLPLVLLMGLSLMALVPGLLGPERSASQRAGLLGLLVLSLLQLFLGVFGGYYGALSGGAGLLAWLLLMLPRR
ncbi:hypothetical protein ATI61_114195 [Archangium gephyra]|uniref:Uncharacterized protein n=1 Tax=Archangium gephyra TaxID=48 RepID=A0AAC8TE11_9BACT|nr:hypothetical protein [Archangium gephyra]AKJ01096.1 Hypothetical protein AA314_02722 [Archangium gephyra]REG24587.1 hypothetical protein ATI61_114195 [Archangium gephyra]